MNTYHREFTLKDGRKTLLRNAVLEDAERLIEYVKATNAETRFLGYEPGEFCMTVQQEREFLRRRSEDAHSLYLVAEIGTEIVGCCDAVPVRDLQRFRHRAAISVSVSKAYWRLGIGRLLLTSILEKCRENGYTQTELEVARDNAPAIALYESLGFVVTGVCKNAFRYPDGSHTDEYFMWLPFDQNQ